MPKNKEFELTKLDKRRYEIKANVHGIAVLDKNGKWEISPNVSAELKDKILEKIREMELA